MVLYKDFHFVHQRFLNLIKRRHGTQVIYMQLRGVVESWIMISLFFFYDIKAMNAEVFAKGLEKCRLLTRLLGQNVEKLDDYGCQKFKILSKWTVCGSALVTLSDTKQGFIVPTEKQRCMEIGLCNICKFCTCFLYLRLILI